MKYWFMSGGWCMITLLLISVPAIGVGVGALRSPTAGKLAALRSLPSLIMLNAVMGLGVNLWSVNQHLTDEAFVKANGVNEAQLPFVAMIGLTESAQTLTLGGLCAMVVIGLRIAAEVRASQKQTAGEGAAALAGA